jgi:hypothetical protein
MARRLNIRLLIGIILCLGGFVQSVSAGQQWYPFPAPLQQAPENSATLYFIGYKIESLKSNIYRAPQKALIAEELLRILHKFNTQLTSNEQKSFIEAAQCILQYAPEAQKRKAETWLIKRMDTRTTPTLSLDKRLAIASFLTDFSTEESLTYIRYALKTIDTLILKTYKSKALDELAAQDLLNWSRLIATKARQ